MCIGRKETRITFYDLHKFRRFFLGMHLPLRVFVTSFDSGECLQTFLSRYVEASIKCISYAQWKRASSYAGLPHSLRFEGWSSTVTKHFWVFTIRKIERSVRSLTKDLMKNFFFHILYESEMCDAYITLRKLHSKGFTLLQKTDSLADFYVLTWSNIKFYEFVTFFQKSLAQFYFPNKCYDFVMLRWLAVPSFFQHSSMS